MTRIVDDCRTQTRLFTCPKCGTEYLADYSEVKEEPWYEFYVTCPVCTHMEHWTSGRVQHVEERGHEE